MALAKYAEDNLEFYYERMAAAEYRRKETERPEKEKTLTNIQRSKTKKKVTTKIERTKQLISYYI